MSARLDLKAMLDAAQEAGAEEAEVFFQDSENTTIKVYHGQVDSLVTAKAKGVGIRTFRNHQVGYAYTSDFSRESIRAVIQASVENAGVGTPDEFQGLPVTMGNYPHPPLFNETLAETPVEEKIELALRMEKVALEYSDKVRSVDEVEYADQIGNVTLMNSRGLEGSYKRGTCYASVFVLAQEGDDVQTGYSFTYGRSLQELKPVDAARDAAANAVTLLGARQARGQEAPVVFRPEVGAMLMAIFAEALTADAVQKGRSLFAGKLGQMVASDQVSIIDDGLMPDGLATAPFDGEGVPSRRTELIENGKLLSFMYDSYTARKGKAKSTGNASRSSYRSTPVPAPNNFFMVPGGVKVEELIGGVKSGFYVMEVSGLGSGGANPISGDFSVGATGRWIRDGRFAEPVREVTIAGNLLNMLGDVDAVADDLKFVPMMGAFGSPTFRVRKMAISGA
ncbi:MAG: TldD/PmbA family protein [Firmicutes bacterium]|nr:TldD/PmbA family protein [Bacillota bacterium]